MHILLHPTTLSTIAALPKFATKLRSIMTPFSPALLKVISKIVELRPPLPRRTFWKLLRAEKPSNCGASDAQFTSYCPFCKTSLVSSLNRIKQCFSLLPRLSSLLVLVDRDGILGRLVYRYGLIS